MNICDDEFLQSVLTVASLAHAFPTHIIYLHKILLVRLLKAQNTSTFSSNLEITR